MTGAEVAELVGAGTAVLGALAAWLRARAAAQQAAVASKKVDDHLTGHP